MNLPRTLRATAYVWAALLLLLLASLGSAYLRLGSLNLLIGLGVASVKIALILRYFMRLDRAPVWSRLAGLVAVCTLALLAALTVFEGVTRPADPAPWQQPEQLPPAKS